ncbi:MAG: YggT family protein [Clostridia bacterium]|nr:YggT family protein [Clostridia bacterium]
MYQILYIVGATVRVVVYVLQFLLLARAILSWLPLDEDNPFENFLYAVTEPVIAPVRALIEHFGWFEGLPIDMSFFITFILLSVIQMFL